MFQAAVRIWRVRQVDFSVTLAPTIGCRASDCQHSQLYRDVSYTIKQN